MMCAFAFIHCVESSYWMQDLQPFNYFIFFGGGEDFNVNRIYFYDCRLPYV